MNKPSSITMSNTKSKTKPVTRVVSKQEPDQICPLSREEWRAWLADNHETATAVWLVYYRKHAGLSSLEYSAAVDEALCFGWIDSTRKPLDGERFLQYFCRRKPGSTWSKVNKEKVKRLTKAGLMATAGLKSIQVAKKNGSWTLLDEVESLTIPADLEKALKSRPGAKAIFLGLSRSVQKAMLHRLVFAKRPETREKRIAETMAEIAKQQNASGK